MTTASRGNAATAVATDPDICGAAERVAARRWATIEGTVPGRAVLDGREVVMLASNDYLGLSTHPHVLRRAHEAIDTHGSSTGINPVVALPRIHRVLIERLCEFSGSDDVLLFNSCTAANCALLPSLGGAEDVIVSDELNHASIIDGARLAAARTLVYDHQSVESLRDVLGDEAADARLRIVVTDGVFSMEGTTAPLDELIAATPGSPTVVVVDESHAAGVVGATGKGTGELYGVPATSFVQTGTFSKALGAGLGGYVAGPSDLIAFLRERARFFIYTSGMPPSAAGAAVGALEVLATEPDHLERLRANTTYLRQGLRELGLTVLGESGPIIPVLIGHPDRAQRLSRLLLDHGAFVPAFSHPIVPAGTDRLRFQVSARHREGDLRLVLELLEKFI